MDVIGGKPWKKAKAKRVNSGDIEALISDFLK